MLKGGLATLCISAVLVGAAAAQARKAAGTNSVTHEIIVTTDTVYTGTIEMAVKGGKVTGNMWITSPTEITGTVAGTAKAGVLVLEFPFLMVERKCEGTVKMNIKLADKAGHGSGTMEAVGCGSNVKEKTTGRVELKPVKKLG